jgi:predicted amidohydrolase YtcJ
MRVRPTASVLIFSVLSACSSAPPPKKSEDAPPPPRADLVLTGGTIETLDGAAGTALAIKAGKIAKVGSDDEIRRWVQPETRVIALQGRTVIPGLVDSHMHLEGLGMRRFGIDLVGTASIEEIKTRVKKAASTAPKGEWIQGRGWDQNDWETFKKKGLKFPTARDLDDVSPNNPVILTRIDGHAIWVNTKAMQAAGVTARSKSKDGGEMLKAGGKPKGIFIDNAIGMIADKVPAPTKEQLTQALLLGQKDCLSAGLVQVHNMGVSATELEALKELEQKGELRVRVYGMLDGGADDLGALMGAGPIIPADSKARLTVRGVKFFADGALGSRGAALLKPYADDKKTSGLLVTSQETLEARVRSAAALKYQVATHAIGDLGNEMTLDVYERVFGSDAKDARPRIEHAQVLQPSDVARFARNSVIASMQPTHATSDMPWAEKRLGKERIAGAYAWRSLLTSGATIAAGSDAPVEDIAPVVGLYAAVTRTDDLGAPEGGWMPEQRMTAREALLSFTQGGAYASFRENEAGVIAEGRVADLTVVDRNPLSTPVEEMNTLQVIMTIINGDIEYAKQGAVPELDLVKTGTTATSTRT